MVINDTRRPICNPMKMCSASSLVSSSQQGIHPRLGALLDKHVAHRWRQPLHPPSVRAFVAAERLLNGISSPLILDSGCGTGKSTRLLARRFPGCLVIGVDKSEKRLAKSGAGEFPRRDGNRLLVRAGVATFWRLALDRRWRLQRHYLLYPNPWPKPAQLQRRWHAHPVFPDLLRLGGRLEMRCNWEIYALEFAYAVNRIRGTAIVPEALGDMAPLSPFERKYRESGHSLYSVVSPGPSGRV